MLVIFGNNWGEAGVYIQILSLWTFAVFISSPLSTVFMVLEKNEFLLKFNIYLLISRVLSIFLGYLMNNARIAMLLFSTSGVFIYGFLGYSLLHYARSNTIIILKNISSFMVFTIPLLLEAILFQILFNKYSLLVAINTFIMSLLFLAILIRKDTDIKEILKNLLNKYHLMGKYYEV